MNIDNIEYYVIIAILTGPFILTVLGYVGICLTDIFSEQEL